MTDRRPPPDPRPLTARSVVLSVLLGSHPPELPVRTLVRLVEPFGVSGSTLRVALTRMVAAGDLLRTDGTYRLADRLTERQRRQDEALRPQTLAWDGTWELVAVTATGRGATERAALRALLSQLRLAELRPGVWLRPANLTRPLPASLADQVLPLDATPRQDPIRLVHSLWGLTDWADDANVLLRRLAAAEQPAQRFTLAAACVRHLLADPVLPPSLVPPGWPADQLRQAYQRYQEEVVSLARELHGG